MVIKRQPSKHFSEIFTGSKIQGRLGKKISLKALDLILKEEFKKLPKELSSYNPRQV